MGRIAVVLAFLSCATALSGQAPDAGQIPSAFEAASVRENRSTDLAAHLRPQPGGG
jgi:hypothetical protein